MHDNSQSMLLQGLGSLELSNYAYQNTDKDTEGNFKME